MEVLNRHLHNLCDEASSLLRRKTVTLAYRMAVKDTRTVRYCPFQLDSEAIMLLISIERVLFKRSCTFYKVSIVTWQRSGPSRVTLAFDPNDCQNA
ncbi:hypothetical protein J6590_010009 [Homalodisca vitripennis]|nr:hypothetical protein J6590_010009 [Homalodisca vitripennis]